MRWSDHLIAAAPATCATGKLGAGSGMAPDNTPAQLRETKIGKVIALLKIHQDLKSVP